MIVLGDELAAAVLAAKALFVMVSLAVYDYLVASAVWAGDHFVSFSHLPR